jgi:hypothetical protein
MRPLISTLALLLIMSSLTSAQKGRKSPAPATSPTVVSKKLEREILKMEREFGQAIAKRDTASLARILADYYADSYEGSERAMSKRGVIALCRDGALPSYAIDEDRKISVSADIVFIEGISKVKSAPAAGADRESENEEKGVREVRVKRMWTHTSRWQLVAQTIERIE